MHSSTGMLGTACASTLHGVCCNLWVISCRNLTADYMIYSYLLVNHVEAFHICDVISACIICTRSWGLPNDSYRFVCTEWFLFVLQGGPLVPEGCKLRSTGLTYRWNLILQMEFDASDVWVPINQFKLEGMLTARWRWLLHKSRDLSSPKSHPSDENMTNVTTNKAKL